jgi:hypothetical protein
MSDVRTMLKRGVGGATPPPGGFERMLRRRDRKRRNQRITAGVVGIAVFVAAIWIIATGGPFDRTLTPSAPGPTGPTGPPPHPASVGLIGFPPEGAPPSTPEHGELVVGIGFGHTPGDAERFSLHVYADGRVIWQRLGGGTGVYDSSTGLIEQRLTPEGVELVRAEVLSTGLFDHDRELVETPGLNYGGIEVLDGNQLVHLTWGDAGFEQGSAPIATIPTPEQVSAVERLDARLENLASWLPDTAWQDPAYRAYVPSRYSVCYMGKDEPLDRARILDLLPVAAADVLRPLDTTQGDASGPRGPHPFWCSVVTTDEVRRVAQILNDAGAFPQSPEDQSLAFSPPSHEVVDIGFAPILPHGEESG